MRPLKFKLSDTTLVSDVNQTLSNLLSQIHGVKKRLDVTEVRTTRLTSANTPPAKLRQIDITQSSTVEGSVLMAAVSVYFQYDPNNPPAAVDIYATGLNSNTNPVLVARGIGTQSPITFSVTASGQQITITAVTENASGVKQPFSAALSVAVTLNGSASAVSGTPTGYGPLGWAAAASTTDSTVNYGNYGYTSMVGLPAGINTTYIYSRWSGYIVPSQTGEYTIGLNSDDGANLYICGQLVGSDKLSQPRAMSANLTYSSGSSAQILLTKGVYYPVTIEWQQGVSNYGIQLLWTPPNSSTQLIPSANLSTSATSVTGNLSGTWWNGSSGLWYPSGIGIIDPGNTVLFGPPTNGGGTNLVNSVGAVTGTQASPQVSPNTFIGPGWIKGQAYSAGGIVDIFVCVGSATQGYLFRIEYRNGSTPAIFKTANLTSSVGTVIATGTANASAITGWINWDIYIGLNGYMALWYNGNLVCQVTDLTYNTIPTSGYTGNQVRFFYEINTTGKVAPVPNSSGAGSSALNSQGSIATVSDYTFSYTSTTTSITWSWSAFTVYNPDGSTVSVTSGSQAFTGLSASHTYYFTPYVTLNGDGTGTANILSTGTSPATLAQLVQIANGDGNVPIAINVTAATPASGSGGGSGGGGGAHCFSPNTKVKTQRGDVRFDELKIGDKVLTARGTWKTVTDVVSRPYSGRALDMGQEELVTPEHLFLEDTWQRVDVLHPEFPHRDYDGTIWNAHVETEADDDGTQADTEHSYTLANGLVVHNVIT